MRSTDGTLLKDVGTGELVTLSSVEQQVELVLAGGSGFGDPAERSIDAVAEDVADGYVSADAAPRRYRVADRSDPLVSA